MCPSERPFFTSRFLTFPTLSTRLGTREALRDKGVPNLPNLPNLFPHVCAGACRRVCRRMHRQACAHTRAQVTAFTLGRLGRLGKGRGDKGFQLPDLCLTSGRLGT